MVTRREPGYLRFTAVYWRSIVALLLFQAVGWALAAGLAFVIADPELAKDYYSAHRTVKSTWRLLLPALAVAAGAGFVLVGVGTGVGLWRHSRRLLRPLHELDAVLRRLGAGQIPAPAAVPPRRPGAAEEAVTVLEPLRERVQELQRISKDIQKSALALNYKASGSVDLTLKDLREAAAQLDALARELDASVRWFEG